jgi:hypothetical protein
MKLKLVIVVTFIFISGCASLSDKGSKVKLVGKESVGTLKNCQKIGIVEATPGAKFGGAKKDNLLIDLKNKTAEKDGNIVLSNMEIKEGFFGANSYSIKGIAFKCSEEIYNNTLDLSEL